MMRRNVVGIVISVVVILALVAGGIFFVVRSAKSEAAKDVNITITENANTTSANKNASATANDEATNTNANENSNASNKNANANTSSGKKYDYISRIPQISQYATLPAGCELVALAATLRGADFNVTPTELADEYLTLGDGFVHTYSGSPYVNGGGLTPVTVDCGNAYLKAKGSNLRFKELKGESLETLTKYIERGIPVMVWTTMSMAEPMLTGITEEGYEWYDNEHCVVLYDFDDSTVWLMDPIDGYVERDRAEFERIYLACGAMAMVYDL